MRGFRGFLLTGGVILIANGVASDRYWWLMLIGGVVLGVYEALGDLVD